jgi:hypothetical protein
MSHKKCNRGKGRAVQWQCIHGKLSLTLCCCAAVLLAELCCVCGVRVQCRIGWCEISTRPTRPTRPQKWKKEEIKKPLDWPKSGLFFIFIDLIGLI